LSRGTPPAELTSRRDSRGRFAIGWPVEDGPARTPRDILRWRWQRAFGDLAKNPPRSAFERQAPDIAVPRAPADQTRITWIGQSGFLLQVAGVNILTDPLFSRRASPFQFAGPARITDPGIAFDALPDIDVVILSHDHYDHLDAPTIARLHRRFGDAIRWVAPLGHAAWLERRGIRNVIELDWWERRSVDTRGGRIDVTATPAQHWTQRVLFSMRQRLWASFVIDAGDERIFFCGDSGYFHGFKAIGERFAPFSVALMPIGAYDPRWFMKPAHMNPEEAVQAWIDLGGTGAFVAMHWGTFRLTDEPPLEPPVRARAAWLAHALDPATLYIPAHGQTLFL
jgi:N-acyl-phosphatidylethanolamine-hydrolysing phospholipase D